MLFRNFGHALPGVSFEGIGIEGGRITMDRPRLSGARPGGGGYEITAVKAMQDAKHPGDVDLALIGGDIATPNREVSRLSANSGHYQGADETLDLAGDVRLTNSRYEITLKSVHIEFKKGEYVVERAGHCAHPAGHRHRRRLLRSAKTAAARCSSAGMSAR